MRPLDAQSRWHLRALARQVAFLTLVGLPALLVDRHPPVLFLLQMRQMFALLAFILFLLGMISRQPISRTHLGIWDHAAACVLLATGYSLALSMTR